MMAGMLGALLVLCIASVSWLFFTYVLKHRLGFSYIGTPLKAIVFFLLLTAAVVFLFPAEVARLYGNPPILAILFCIGILCVINPFLYAYARKKGSPANAHRDLEMLSLRWNFLVSKPSDVLYQQTSFGVFLLLLAGVGVPFEVLLVLFVAAMFLTHLGMFLSVPRRFAWYFLVSSVVFSIPVVWLILFVPGGVYYALGLHMLWYALGGAGIALATAHRERVVF